MAANDTAARHTLGGTDKPGNAVAHLETHIGQPHLLQLCGGGLWYFCLRLRSIPGGLNGQAEQFAAPYGSRSQHKQRHQQGEAGFQSTPGKKGKGFWHTS